jgi:3-methylfumaryl-CoA hydratase
MIVTLALRDEIYMLAPLEVTHLQSWIGKTETLDDELRAAPVRGLSATLDRNEDIAQGLTVLPPLWHWLYFLPQHQQSEIAADGHPKRGGFLPPVALPRRMWAGGRLHWLPENPLRVGDSVQRISRIEQVSHKVGRTGELLFVQVRHEVRNGKGLALTEEQDIVYRAAALPGDSIAPPVASDQVALWQQEIVPNDVLLFRYSALTFNAHRIHYDRKYVTEVEGYPGLVVHGPLIATLLIDLLRLQLPGVFIKSFRFKSVRPSFDLHPLRLNASPSPDGKTVELCAQDHLGWVTMQATAELA